MEDPLQAHHDDEDADEQRRVAEATMEEFLRAQEEAEQQGNDENNGVHNNDAILDDERMGDHLNGQIPLQRESWIQPQKPFRLSYVSTSLLAAFAMIVYALRTREQWYLALVYLNSSKWAYVVFGNALVATLVSMFSIITNTFLNGLRLHEAEGLGDFFRWNITETCLALTMFRAELNVKTAAMFLFLVLAKCLHWVVELREQHLRMTEEAVVVHATTGWPGIQWPHFKLFVCLLLFQLCDILAVIECGMVIVKSGPSVAILFAFEGSILLVTVMSSILLWYLHVLDGLFHYAHENTRPGSLFHGWIYPWKDYKATLVFAVEVQAQAAKFFFYISFFAIVMTFYGLPINLLREVYMSFQALKQRVVAFGKYRRLMASMDRFENPTEEELQEAGYTCIICREDMTVATAKRLPGCGHIFHKSCLRDWLVQQQTCPTCRSDITVMQERQKQRDAALVLQRQMDDHQHHHDHHHHHPAENDDPGAVGEPDVAGGAGAMDTDQQQSPDMSPEQPLSHPTTGEDATLTEQTIYTNTGLPPASPNPADVPQRTEEKPVQNQVQIADSEQKREGNHAFPAFYRVCEHNGAAVYDYEDGSNVELRRVTCGVVVLGQELSWRSADRDGNSCLMVRVPGGWVKDSDLKRITAVPL